MSSPQEDTFEAFVANTPDRIHSKSVAGQIGDLPVSMAIYKSSLNGAGGYYKRMAEKYRDKYLHM
jgi:chromosome segregation ATPase